MSRRSYADQDPRWPVYSDAEMSALRKIRNQRPEGLGTVILTKRPEPPKPIEPEVTLEDLKAKLKFNPKHPDTFEAWVVAKHLRILGLAEELGIDQDEPDSKQFRVSIGTIKKALNR